MSLINKTRKKHIMKIAKLSVKRVFADGRHNAFTNMARFKDHYYIAFRSGSFHCSMDGHIVVIRSRDLNTWEKTADLFQVDRDSRDAQLMALDDRLVVISFVSDKRYGKIFDHQAVYAATQDGVTWSAWKPFLEKHAHLWSVKKFGDHYYAGLFYNYHDPKQWKAGLAKSKDGFEWECVSLICEENAPDETAIEFLADGTCVALVRRTHASALIATARPPYKDWKIKDSGYDFGGPALANIQGHLLLGSRWSVALQPAASTSSGKPIQEENQAEINYVTALFELREDGVRTPFVLPSLMDTGYPGFAHLGGKHWCMCYYSSHDNVLGSDAPCDIYLAQFEVEF